VKAYTQSDLFFKKGGTRPLAVTKEQKREMVAKYGEWLERSDAFVLAEYTGMTMKDMDQLRAKIREAGGEFHVVKNTLAKLALKDAEIDFNEEHFLSSTAIGFALEDPPALAKAITDFASESDFLKIKVGYLDKQMMSAVEVKALADLPPLPVMRATLLSTLLAPASKLVQTLAEPGRQVAAVMQAYSERDAAPEAA
jgi:large subunit ribosomal protein L10